MSLARDKPNLLRARFGLSLYLTLNILRPTPAHPSLFGPFFVVVVAVAWKEASDKASRTGNRES